MATIKDVNDLNYANQYYASAATNVINPGFITFGYPGGMTDPLNRGVPAAPHVETEKEWLRRRINETLWRAA